MGAGEKGHEVFLFMYFCVKASFPARMFHGHNKYRMQEQREAEKEEKEEGRCIGKSNVSGEVVRG